MKICISKKSIIFHHNAIVEINVMIPANVMYNKMSLIYHIPKNLILWTSTWYVTQRLGRTTHAIASADNDLFMVYRLFFCDTTENTQIQSIEYPDNFNI